MKRLIVGALVALLTFVGGRGAAAALDALARAQAQPPVRVKPEAPNADTLELVFVLDTTGSMGGLLDGAKQASGASSTK